MKHAYSVIKNLLNNVTPYAEGISYLLLYFFSAYPCFKHIKGNFFYSFEILNNIFCFILIACLTLLLLFLYRHYQQHSRHGFCIILPLACLCTLAAQPTLLHIWTDSMISIFYITGFLAITYSICRQWSFIIWFFWLLLPLAETVASVRYQLTVDAHLISEMIGASPQDVKQFITLPNCVLICTWLIGTLLLGIALNQIIRRYTEKQLFIPGLIIIVFALGISTATKRPLWSHALHRAPESSILQFYQAAKLATERNSHIIKLAEDLPSPSCPKPCIPEGKQSTACICLLHIGESVRSDHLSLFGYSKQTTPNLDKRKNLIAYQDCVSVAPSTVPSTFAILTNAKTDVRQESIDSSLNATCGGIMDIFHSLGFGCYAFLSKEDVNETWGMLYEKLIHRVFAGSADKICAIPKPDDSHSQIQQISDILNSAQEKNIFCLINNNGSHLPFIDFNWDKPPFPPASYKAYSAHPDRDDETAAIVQNTYDCTIHYLDAYIEQLIEQLKGKPFVYIYISDHGEFLGDQGIWVRTGNEAAFFSSAVCQVPLLIISSPEFEQQNPHFKEALEHLRKHCDMSIGQEHIFHTLLGIFGIQTPYYDEELDLTSDKVKPYTGPHPSRNGKSADGKKWY